MTWSKFENKDEPRVQPPDHEFGKWYSFSNPVNTAETIKYSDTPCETNIHLYTDGSAKGASQIAYSGDGKSFAGWGSYMLVDGPDGKQEISHNGGIFNADAHTAELSAVIQSVSRIKGDCNLHIHTDSYYVVSAMSNLHAFIANRRAAIDNNPSNRRRVEKVEYQRLGLWEMLQKELDKKNIKEVKIQWIKGHQMDNADFSRKNVSAEMLRDIKGNDAADRLSNIGAIKAVVDAIHELGQKMRYNPAKAEIHTKSWQKIWRCHFLLAKQPSCI
jgi:ribonuclease HI